MISPERLLGILESAPCGHWSWPTGKRPNKVVYSWDSNGGTDSYGEDTERSGFVLFRCGREFFVLADSEDYSGHGCQCDGYLRGPFASLSKAKTLGLTDEERKRMDE